MTPYFSMLISGLAMTMLGISMASGQPYPNKPIRFVTAPAGGGADLVSRLIAQGLSAPLGVSVIVDNRGGGVLTATSAATASPDGYTLHVTGTLWLLPLFQNDFPWDPLRDFSPISLTNRAPNVLVVHPSLPVKSLKELIALAKSRPGELNYASGPPGTPNYIAGELFKSLANIDAVGIPYKGAGPAVVSLLSGQVQFIFAAIGLVEGHAKSGRLRILAITTAQRSVLAPDLPTVAELGIAGYESTVTYGVLAPANTPEPIIKKLHQEIVGVLSKTEMKEKFHRAGLEVIASTPEDLTNFMKAEMARVRNIAR